MDDKIICDICGCAKDENEMTETWFGSVCNKCEEYCVTCETCQMVCHEEQAFMDSIGRVQCENCIAEAERILDEEGW